MHIATQLGDRQERAVERRRTQGLERQYDADAPQDGGGCPPPG